MKKNVFEYLTSAGLPDQAINILQGTYCKKDFSDVHAVDVISDPQAPGVFAVRLNLRKPTFRAILSGGVRQFFEEERLDLLWRSGDFDEVIFSTWPPTQTNF